MISKEEIQKLADLARIEIKEEELESLRGEMDSILEYIGQVKSVGETRMEQDDIMVGSNFNIFRKDENPTESGKYAKDLLAEAPSTHKGYLKVKKIL